MTARQHARPGGPSRRSRAEVRRRMGEAIDRHRQEIETRWLERVQADIVKTPGIETTQLRDGLPDYLRSIVALLEEEADAVKPAGTSAWEQVAREHGVTRVKIGFNIGQLIREFVVLRKVI